MRGFSSAVGVILALVGGAVANFGDFVPSVQHKEGSDTPWTPVAGSHVFQLQTLKIGSNNHAKAAASQSSSLEMKTPEKVGLQSAPVITQQTQTLIPLAPVIAIPFKARPPPNKRPTNPFNAFLWGGRNSKSHPPPFPPKRDVNKMSGKQQQRDPRRKIVPSTFLKKIARKVFFPDRRNDHNNNNNSPHQRRPTQHPPTLRFEQNGKVLFPQQQPQNSIQFDSHRLRLAIQQALCAFSTVSTGMNGESCIES